MPLFRTTSHHQLIAFSRWLVPALLVCLAGHAQNATAFTFTSSCLPPGHANATQLATTDAASLSALSGELITLLTTVTQSKGHQSQQAQDQLITLLNNSNRQTNTETAQHLLDKSRLVVGAQLIQTKQYEKARLLLKQIQQTSSPASQGAQLIMQSYLAEGRFEHARTWHTKTTGAFHFSANTLYNLLHSGSLFERHHQYQDAREIYNMIAALSEKNYQKIMRWLHTYASQGNSNPPFWMTINAPWVQYLPINFRLNLHAWQQKEQRLNTLLRCAHAVNASLQRIGVNSRTGHYRAPSTMRQLEHQLHFIRAQQQQIKTSLENTKNKQGAELKRVLTRLVNAEKRLHARKVQYATYLATSPVLHTKLKAQITAKIRNLAKLKTEHENRVRERVISEVRQQAHQFRYIAAMSYLYLGHLYEEEVRRRYEQNAAMRFSH